MKQLKNLNWPVIIVWTIIIYTAFKFWSFIVRFIF
jgi:hypothetical protein